MKKTTLYVLLVVVLVALGFSIKHDMDSKKSLSGETPVEAHMEGTIAGDVKTAGAIASVPTLDQTWNSFQEYLKAAKNHDLTTVKKLSHKLSAVCEAALTDASKKAECFVRLDQGHGFGSSLNKKDFEHILADNKQVILSSKWESQEDTEKKSYFKSLLYFTVEKGTVKLIGADPQREFAVAKDGRTTGQLEGLLQARMKDGDSDGIEDQIETCEFKISDAPCVKTDPNKRDSNGNSYWDGIEEKL